MKINNAVEAKVMMDGLVAQYSVVKDAMTNIYVTTCDGAEINEIEIDNTTILIEGYVAGAPASWVIEIATGNIIDTYNAEYDMEDEEMEVIREEVEVTLGDKAKEFAEAKKEQVIAGFKFFLSNSRKARQLFDKISNMSTAEAEAFLAKHGEEFFNKMMAAFEEYCSDMKHGSEIYDNLKNRYQKCSDIIALIREILDDDKKKGWGKFVEIVKSIIMWLVRLFFKVASIVLKLTFTVAVGVIKIGCTAINTTISVAKAANKEIVKPTVKTGKNAWGFFKAKVTERKARMDAARDMLFEDDFDDFFDDDDEVVVVAEQ